MQGATDLNFVIDRLEDWYAEVTGEDLKKREEMKNDEFFLIEKKIRETVQKARRLQEERNEEIQKEEHSAAAVMRKTTALKDLFKDIEESISSMGKIIERQKKTKKLSEEEADKKMRVQLNYKNVVKNLKEREKDTEIVSKKPRKPALNKSVNLSMDEEDLNGSLLDKEELDDDENEALKRWAETDKKIDGLIEGVINNLDLIHNGLKDQEGMITENRQLTRDLGHKVDKVTVKFETANSKMKKIITQFRAPHSFCIDVCLVLVFLVLLGILFKVAFR